MSYELFNLNAPAVNEDASGHADIFKEERLADADLCICISSKTDSITAIAGETTAKKQRLSQCAANKFPVHLVLLRKCPFFDSQAQRWQDSSSHGSGSRVQLTLTLDDASHEAAAVAVVGWLYGIPLNSPQLQLHQADLVQAVRYADLLQVPRAAADAVRLLQAAACNEFGPKPGLMPATMQELADLQAWPSCLLPVIPAICFAAEFDTAPVPAGASSGSSSSRSSSSSCSVASVRAVLLSALGDLEAVWRDQHARDTLLHLPLGAMQLLLSSDRLKVASEDTVLFTATMYIAQVEEVPILSARPFHARSSITEHCAQALAPLIRCQHLSQFQLAAWATAAADCHPTAVLYSYRQLLPTLASLLRLPGEPPQLLQEAAAARRLGAVPASWLLGPRQLQPAAAAADGVEVRWQLPVSSIQEWSKEVFFTGWSSSLHCSSCSTPPLAGLAWRVGLLCKLDEEGDGGVTVELAASPVVATPRLSALYKCRFEMIVTWGSSSSDEAAAADRPRELQIDVTTPPLRFGQDGIWPDSFGVGVMRDGWDAAAWAAAGLPAAGELAVVLRVLKVY